MVFSNEPFKVQRPAIPTPLEAAQHTFKVYRSGLTILSRWVRLFSRQCWNFPWIQVTAINVSNRKQQSLRQISKSRIKLTSSMEPPRDRISHVIQSSDMSILEAQLHLHEEGAKRVFGAGSSDALQLNSNAGRFRMLDQIRTRVLTINSRIESTQVFILVPSYVSIERSKYSVFWNVLSRDAVGACYLWAIAVDGREGPGVWEEQMEDCLEWFLGPLVSGAGRTEGVEGSPMHAASNPMEKLMAFGPQRYDKESGLYRCGSASPLYSTTCSGLSAGQK
ncbi:hypothetical protein BST61_g39 [Cercospora zeina]